MQKVQAVDEDGTLRMVRIGNPDTFYSRPARARIKGEVVFGFVSVNEHRVLTFIRSNHQGEARKAYRRSIRD